ncbi:MAG: sulfurtransferase-like selenium metabolism protein YedF [Thermodesulfobacteriota bacterium]
MPPTTLDCRGLNCPQPVIRTKERLAAATDEDSLLVLVDNEAARDNVRRFAESQGHKVEVAGAGRDFHLLIQRGTGQAGPEPEIVCPPSQQGSRRVVVHIGSEYMGQGDDGLGERLMAAYFDSLAQFAQDITHLTLVNSGVKLAATGSPVLAEAQELRRLGVEILACGVCLNHYGLADELAVGLVSNMYSILAAQQQADLLLSPM